MPTCRDDLAARSRPVTPIAIASELLQDLVRQCNVIEDLQIDPAFIDQLQRASAIVSGLEPYVEKQTSQPSERLQQLAERSEQHNWMHSFESGETSLQLEQEMLSGHTEGEFLKMLVTIAKAKSILEIGMFTGYGTMAMAEAIPDEGRLTALEFDRFVADFAQESFSLAQINNKIRVIIGPADESLQTLIAEHARFDFVFIDADKAGYRGYLETLLVSDLLTDDALICVDNTLLQAEPYLDRNAVSENGHAIAEFNDYVASRRDLHHVLVPIRDGVTLIRRLADAN